MSDSIEIELDDRPTVVNRGPGPTTPGQIPPHATFGQVVTAIQLAPTWAAVDAIIAPLRTAWTEEQKARLRPTLRAKEVALRSNPGPSKPAPSPAVVKPGPKPEPGSTAAVDMLAVDMLIKLFGWASQFAGPIVHTPTGPGVFDLPRSQRRAIPVIREQAQALNEVRAQVGKREIVAGAKTEGSGVFLGWRGFGDVTVAGVRGAVERAGEDPNWAPAPKSAHYHASAAFAPLNQGGLVVRSERGKRARTSLYTGLQRTYAAAWTVIKPDHSDVGEKAGTTVLRAQLGADGLLEIDAEPEYAHLKEQVQADFQRRVDEEIVPAGEVTYWLQLLLTGRLGAQRVGGMYYVPHKYAARAERVCTELATGGPDRTGAAWGIDWCLPAIPVATTDQLRAGLTRGFRDEVGRLLADLSRDDERAKGEGRKGLGTAAACSYMQRLRTVNERAREYAALLGEGSVAELRRAIGEAQAVLEPLCDDTAQRFAALEAYP